MLAKTMWQVVGAIRLTAFVIVSLLLGLAQLVSYPFSKNHLVIPKLFHRACCFIMNVKVSVEGVPSNQQTLFLCNHLSWADIFVLGSITDAIFVAKSEVASWPLLGALARLQQTIFISREKFGLMQAKKWIKEALQANESLILFAEGTNTVGEKVLPFKSSLLSVLGDGEGLRISVQPVAVIFDDDESLREIYGWGDVEFMPHLWAFACTPSLRVRLKFCDVIASGGNALNRKEIASVAEEAVRKAVG